MLVGKRIAMKTTAPSPRRTQIRKFDALLLGAFILPLALGLLRDELPAENAATPAVIVDTNSISLAAE